MPRAIEFCVFVLVKLDSWESVDDGALEERRMDEDCDDSMTEDELGRRCIVPLRGDACEDDKRWLIDGFSLGNRSVTALPGLDGYSSTSIGASYLTCDAFVYDARNGSLDCTFPCVCNCACCANEPDGRRSFNWVMMPNASSDIGRKVGDGRGDETTPMAVKQSSSPISGEDEVYENALREEVGKECGVSWIISDDRLAMGIFGWFRIGSSPGPDGTMSDRPRVVMVGLPRALLVCRGVTGEAMGETPLCFSSCVRLVVDRFCLCFCCLYLSSSSTLLFRLCRDGGADDGDGGCWVDDGLVAWG